MTTYELVEEVVQAAYVTHLSKGDFVGGSPVCQKNAGYS